MATTTADVQLSTLPPATGSAGLRGVLASEFTKLRSVRSTYWTLGLLFVLCVGIAVAIGAGMSSEFHNQPWNKAGQDTTQTMLTVFTELGQLVIAVIGAMVITSEYSNGMIRTSLTAMPRRGTVYLGKVIVFTITALVISLVTSFVAFFAGQSMLSGSGVQASLFHSVTIPANVNITGPGPNGPGGGSPNYQFFGTDTITPHMVLFAIIGSALYVTIAALIAYGLGAIIRHTAGAIASVFGLMFVVQIVVQLLPQSWRWDMLRFLPSSAGQIIPATIGQTNNHMWSAWPQLGVTAVWAAALVIIGFTLFRKRDA
jgi:ABC-type transport system involved in multi-copper enzyme maturation permease subunit